MSKKMMLLGIAIILTGIALSMNHVIAFGSGVAGLILAVIGLFLKDN